ncbi:hypothetical protein AAE478_006313 [Parahypoxylon ruwenzoriense]
MPSVSPPPSNPGTLTTVRVIATYMNSTSNDNASSKPFTLLAPLPIPPGVGTNSHTDFTPQRIAYLRALRNAVSELQERTNAELTVRMEGEAAARKATTLNGKSEKNVVGVDEVAEEENYGEEVVDEGE